MNHITELKFRTENQIPRSKLTGYALACFWQVRPKGRGI